MSKIVTMPVEEYEQMTAKLKSLEEQSKHWNIQSSAWIANLTEERNKWLVDCKKLSRAIGEKKVQEILDKAQSEEWDVWNEYTGIKAALKLDPGEFGPHDYDFDKYGSRCGRKCGCFIGESMSGGPFLPSGPCPNNPIKSFSDHDNGG